MHTQSSVEFGSELFKPFLPEVSQVNPSVYGAELEFRLARQLAERGIVMPSPEYEVWVWYIENMTDTGDEYWLC
ncbi:MAG: hypothetical protein ACU85E_10670 [Gammaproteobacteria bacterium]